jgi:hypothetical protein
MSGGLSQAGPALKNEEVGTGREPRHLAQQGSCAASASGHASVPANPATAQESSSECSLAKPSSSRASTLLTEVRSRSAKCSSIAT